ncbi:MAG: hypothetical protein MST00_00500 [Tenericutes bacterium]|nr:hypothetical protein [Mycoplasmatota bacterium]
MKEQHNQKKLSIYVTLLIVVICLFGISFALFKFNASQATQNDITTLNCFEVEYSDVTDAITIANDYPISDAEGLKRTPYTFKIKNKCSQLLSVQIGVETLTTSQIQPNLIKGVITNKGETPTSAKLLSNGILGTPVNGGTNYILLEDTIYGSQEKEYDLRLWFTESMTKEQGSGKTYQGKVTVISSPKTEEPVQFLTAIMRDNTVTETLTQPGKEVSAHTLDDVQVQTTSVSSTYQAYYITYGTGWEANGTKFNLTGTAVTSDTYANSYSTLVGKYLKSSYLESAGSSTAGTMKTTTNLFSVCYVISATSDSFTYKILGSNKNTTEALLTSTEDDYGTSYYFRGAVTNNFVEYANMCWRIVRVTGDGSIKLVLYNYNGLTSTNNTRSSSTPCNVTGNDLAFARYEGDTYKSAFNSSYNDNAYVGFMFGAANASSYAAAHVNTNPSTILTNLNKWYTNVLSKQTGFSDNKLADTIWCNDKSVVTDATFNPNSLYLETNFGYARNSNYYSATKRLQSTSGSAGGTGPSLICPNDNNGGKLSKYTVSDTEYGNGALSGYAKVGLLTADEIAFAGGAYSSGAFSTGNTTYYINGNTNSSDWWALSPSYFSSRVYDLYVSGDLNNLGNLGDSFAGGNWGMRPSLSLVASTKVTGAGTATNPYKVITE